MRALLLVLDSVGCGHAPDAAAYGDEGADTLGHIFAAQPAPRAARALFARAVEDPHRRRPRPPLAGHGRAASAACASVPRARTPPPGIGKSPASSSTSPSRRFPNFRPNSIARHRADAKRRVHRQLRAQRHDHPRGTRRRASSAPANRSSTRPPIPSSRSPRTSASFRCKRLYEICRVARRHADAWRIGRVIARPFDGEPGAFRRTSGRHDFSMVPPRTVLNADRGDRPAGRRRGQDQRHLRRQRHHALHAHRFECRRHGGHRSARGPTSRTG